jgi:predicted phosphodiesterase
MPNSYKPGAEPTCPVCGVNPIKSVGSKRCSQCRYQNRTAPEAPAQHTPITCFEDAWLQWQREIGQAESRYRRPAPTGNGARKRYVILSDLHVPFHEPSMLAEALAREKGKADCAVILGDLSDAYALSRFLLYERVPFPFEWAQVTAALELIASSFPEVVLVTGNHDARLEKALLSRLTTDMVDAVRWLCGGNLCPLTALAKRYPNVTVANHRTRDGHTLDWCVSIGDAWLAHPERFSRVPGSALRAVEEWLADQREAFSFNDSRLMVIGHTHQYAQIPWHADKLLVEAGCMCRLQGYMATPKIGGRPQRRGYLAFEQERGRTDLNSVRFHCFDWTQQEAA